MRILCNAATNAVQQKAVPRATHFFYNLLYQHGANEHLSYINLKVLFIEILKAIYYSLSLLTKTRSFSGEEIQDAQAICHIDCEVRNSQDVMSK
jgi:hypothetical protein